MNDVRISESSSTSLNLPCWRLILSSTEERKLKFPSTLVSENSVDTFEAPLLSKFTFGPISGLASAIFLPEEIAFST